MLLELRDKVERLAQKNRHLHSLMLNLQGQIGFLLNKISNCTPEKYRFLKEVGYWPDIKNPRSFNEKVFWKKIHDRNPLLVKTSDKYRVRSYIKDVLGEERAEEILIPLLHVTDNPEDLPFDKLPENFVIKPNHASGKVIISKDGGYDEEKITKTCNFWLKTSYGKAALEWAYQNIDRKILVEKLLTDEEGKVPDDYKFYMINGECEFLQINLDRFSNIKKSLYYPNWEKIPAIHNRPPGPEVPEPENLDEMLEISERLSQDFDMVRVDLYSLKGKTYFGELTHYPVSGMGRFEPRKFDYKFGKSWEIEPEYWKE